MTREKTIDLQYFAEAGTLVNSTAGYVNSGTGAVTDFDSANTLSAELKSYYDTELLENARAELFYAQFAKRQGLPVNHHGSVEWRKWNTFARASKLTEGVIPTGQKFGVTNVTGTIDQYGTYTSITDKLELRAYDDVILGATEEMGASAAETQEKLIRDALLTGTNVLYCDNINKDTGAYISTPNCCNGSDEGAHGHVALMALVVLIMCLETIGPADDLLISLVSDTVFDGDDHGLIHLVGNYLADAGLSGACSFFTHYCLPPHCSSCF